MKKIRLKVILLTLASYYVFIVSVTNFKTDKAFVQNDAIIARINHLSKTETRIYRIEFNSGMDPTPIPPFPWNAEMDTELID